MADKNFVIEIRARNEGDEARADFDNENEAAEILEKRNKAKKTALKKVANYAYAEIRAQVQYDVGKYVNLTENYKASVLMSNIDSTAQKAMSIVGVTTASAQLGAMLGAGVGAGIGAAAGFLMGVASETMSLVRQYDQQNLSINMNETYAGYSRSRLGLIDNGRGTQN